MTTSLDMDRIEAEVARSSTLVWIDAREAVIASSDGKRVRIDRVESDVPAHHRSTGHVRHDPSVRHGGGGSPQTAGEAHRLEHLKQFVVDVANRLPSGDALLILGAGTVHERLAQHLSESDVRHGRGRDIVCEASLRLTDRQLTGRLRRFAGVEPRRRTVGAYRWTGPQEHGSRGSTELPPRRVVRKTPRPRRQDSQGD
jgi:hypothetical protein